MQHSVASSLYDQIQPVDRAARIIGYLPGCYPDRPTYRRALELVYRAGIRAVEIGVPGAIGSLEGGVISDALRSVERAVPSRHDVVVNASRDVVHAGLIPIVMAFRGTVFDEIGYPTFIDSVVEGQASLILVPDAEPEEYGRLRSYAAERGVRTIPFSSATDDAGLLKENAPFVYLQTADMPTGGDFSPSKDLRVRIDTHVARYPDVPVGVGFGIRTAEDVDRVHALGADFAIIGTAMVETLSQGLDTFSRYLRELTGREADR